MLFFLGLFFYIVIVSLVVYKRKLPYQQRGAGDKLFICLTMGVLMILTCLRGIDVGNDTKSYYYIFNFAKNQARLDDMSVECFAWLSSMEIGYRLLERVVLFLTDNYQIFICTIAVVSYYVITKFIYCYSSNIVISVILFYLLFWGDYVNLLRQVLALSLILIAIHELKNNHKILFYLLVIVASAFHTSAFFAFGYLLLVYVRPTRSNKIKLLAIAVVLGLFGQITNIMSSLGIVTSYANVESGWSNYYQILRNVLLCGTVCFMKRGLDTECFPQEGTLSVRLEDWIPSVCLALSVIAIGLPIITRVELYYSILLLIVLPKYFTKKWIIETNKGIVLWFIFIVLILIVAGTIVFRPEWVTEYEYHFFWNNHL